MGIDVYLKWDGQTEEEQKAQITGFSVVHGNIGYLREAYHGGPYATKSLFPECWAEEQSENGVPIPNATLRDRLPEVLRIVKHRAFKLYDERLADTDPVLESFRAFVLLHGQLEEAGKHPLVYASY